MSGVDSITSVEYREIPDLHGYRFGSDGSVWSRRLSTEWRLMKQGKGRKGYATVGIHGRTCQVHALICRAFYGLPPLKLLEARHLNDDRSDNRIDNLAWGTRKQNREDMVRNGRSCRGERCHSARLNEQKVKEIRLKRAAGVDRPTLSREYGIGLMAVDRIVFRRTWKHVE